jgi:hypothetical protein
MNDKNDYIKAARQIIISLGLPRAQQNERSALCLLALLNLTPGKAWTDAENSLMGITPIMDWAREHYDTDYAPNTPPCWPGWASMWIHAARCLTWCCTTPRKTGCYWWSPLPVTARSMASGTSNWRSCSLDQPPGWCLCDRFPEPRHRDLAPQQTRNAVARLEGAGDNPEYGIESAANKCLI